MGNTSALQELQRWRETMKPGAQVVSTTDMARIDQMLTHMIFCDEAAANEKIKRLDNTILAQELEIGSLRRQHQIMVTAFQFIRGGDQVNSDQFQTKVVSKTEEVLKEVDHIV